MKEKISLSDFEYTLPDDRIASQPLSNRDQSKLLVYQNSEIKHSIFAKLPCLLPANATLVFNNTRVIHARLFFKRKTGAMIEVFLLRPLMPTSEMQTNLQSTSSVVWECMIGNLKRWKEDEILRLALTEKEFVLEAKLLSKESRHVEFNWKSGLSFARMIEVLGNIPLPPYIKREMKPEDRGSYQTIYASQEGAVAAPTAGLHFTPQLLKDIQEKGFKKCQLTLHVGAGTFQPVTAENIWDHHMHSEFFKVGMETLGELAKSEVLIPVGTTSLRTIESLYWLGLHLHQTGEMLFHLNKEYPYENEPAITYKQALETLIQWCNRNSKTFISADTALLIVPGYRFQSSKILLTNFHMPCTTLILLIAAFIGETWRELYSEALNKDYRFLSFGDSCLLFRDDPAKL
jgi:S-adenosylmethionine:tRNA ribosyltransferase-isomerase